MINLSSLEIKNQNLVIRVDMNVPISGGKVLDTTRITACIPTINFALKNNAKILLVSHLGRPTESVFEDQFSLKLYILQFFYNFLHLYVRRKEQNIF